jgi:hypothetical protein
MGGGRGNGGARSLLTWGVAVSCRSAAKEWRGWGGVRSSGTWSEGECGPTAGSCAGVAETSSGR